MNFRIGHGYDIHRIVPGRPLVLGGVKFDTDYGLEGHSDADCLTHAICDALLGAAGLPDIGHFFPNTDPAYHNIDSQVLLAPGRARIARPRLSIGNLDATLIAEKPRIYRTPRRNEGRPRPQPTFRDESIGLKATTNEGVGDLGRGLAIAAHAVALIEKA
jgi:2-C-methyl-D-erythritol 2,4-cyclodiphosphate synthase